MSDRRAPWSKRLLLALILVGTHAWSSAAPTENVKRAPTPRDLIELSDFLAVEMSPNHRHVAFLLATPSVSRNEVSLEWYIGNLDPVRDPVKVADGGAPMWVPLYGILASPRALWGPDSRSLYFLALHGEELGLWRTTIDGRVEKLTRERGNLEDFIIDPAGETVIFQVSAAREAIKQAELLEYRRGIRLSPELELEDHLFRNLPYRGRMTTIRHDARLDMGHEGQTLLIEKADQNIRVLDLSTHTSRAASPAEAAEYLRRKGDSDPAGSRIKFRKQVSETGPTAFARVLQSSIDADGTQRRPAKPATYQIGFSPDGNEDKAKWCMASACRTVALRDLDWRPESREIVFTVQLPIGVTSVYAWDTSQNAVRTIISTPGLLGAIGDGASRVSAASCPMSERSAVCTYSNASVPPRLEILDLSTGERRLWFEPNSRFKSLRLGRVEPVVWHDRWGGRLRASSYCPAGDLAVHGPSSSPVTFATDSCGVGLVGMYPSSFWRRPESLHCA